MQDKVRSDILADLKSALPKAVTSWHGNTLHVQATPASDEFMLTIDTTYASLHRKDVVTDIVAMLK